MTKKLSCDELEKKPVMISVTQEITEQKKVEFERERLQSQLLQAQKIKSVGRLAWISGDNLWRMKIDPAQIVQIMANLCVNTRDALKAWVKYPLKLKMS